MQRQTYYEMPRTTDQMWGSEMLYVERFKSGGAFECTALDGRFLDSLLDHGSKYHCKPVSFAIRL